MQLQDIILIDPVHLEKGISLDEFLEDFPSVERQQVIGLLEIIEHTFSSEKGITRLYESAA